MNSQSNRDDVTQWNPWTKSPVRLGLTCLLAALACLAGAQSVNPRDLLTKGLGETIERDLSGSGQRSDSESRSSSRYSRQDGGSRRSEYGEGRRVFDDARRFEDRRHEDLGGRNAGKEFSRFREDRGRHDERFGENLFSDRGGRNSFRSEDHGASYRDRFRQESNRFDHHEARHDEHRQDDRHESRYRH